MKYFVSSLILLYFANGFAQFPASPQLINPNSNPKTSIHYSFPHIKKGEKNLAELKLTSQKNNLLLDLEASGLKKGKYKIVLTDQCKVSMNSKKLKFISEIYKFETEYGEVSSEDNLPSSLVASLNSTENKIALLKTMSNKMEIVACGILQTQNPAE